MRISVAVLVSLGVAVPSWGAPEPAPRQADALAREALALVGSDPPQAFARARRALALSAEFQPTDFVRAGRKDEVVEDAFLEARGAYRRHRAVLYRAVGEALLASGQPLPALRHLRRAELLDGDAGALPALVKAHLALGRAGDAVHALLRRASLQLDAGTLALAEQAADAAGLPSLQAELDRARLLALRESVRPETRDGPLAVPERARLSTGAPLRFDDADLTLVYVAEASCRSCTADLEGLRRAVPAGVRLYVASEDPGQDQALRQALTVYRYDRPVVNGARLAAAFGARAPFVLVSARAGFVGALAAPPFEERLPPVLQVLSRVDVRETRPRPAWNRRPPERRPPAPAPGLLEGGFAPGEDEPVPAAFAEALAAFRAQRFGDALARLESLPAEDGWLLPPEARYDRALCLAGLGRREEARRLLLRIGDSRFQDAVDTALERVAAPR